MTQLEVLIAAGLHQHTARSPEGSLVGGLRLVHLASEVVISRLHSKRPLAVVLTTSLESWESNRIQQACEATRTPFLFIDTPDGSDTSPITLANLVQAVWIATLNTESIRSAGRPLLSIFTPTNGPATFLLRAYRSLRRQTYDNWEWILLEDTDEMCSTTRELIHRLTMLDNRVRAVSSTRCTGRVGQLKGLAARMCGGDLLLELDHDDELTPTALHHMAAASLQFPDCGMFYTNWAELVDGVDAQWYGSTFGFGFGYYITQIVDGTRRLIAVSPELNGHTVRHIVSMPNHLRAWRTPFYHEIGGHNPNLPVCDDYELLVRSFLATRMVHLHHCSYIQHFRSDRSNTQFARNPSIHSAVQAISRAYEQDIRSRFQVLGIRDSVVVKADGRDARPTKANFVYTPISVE